MCLNMDKKEGTIYADLTGKFPIISIHGMTAMLIMYYWTYDAILATPIKEAKAETIVECFKQKITYLSKRVFKPVYNIIDNLETKAIKTYLESENIKVQFLTSYDHRVNAAERAIQNFKNHTISGLCICERSIPINIMVIINQTIARHINHSAYLRSAPKVVSIPCPRRTA